MINNEYDYARMQNEGWYRIPIESAPPIINRKEAKIIAFYATQKVKGHKWQIKHYGAIKYISEVGRRELFPDESLYSSKANKRYYKIELEKIEELPQPIVSRRGHRNVFIPTSEQRFFNTTDINYLFNGSSLENSLFSVLDEAKIPFEREWRETVRKMTYFLDFAIFCKTRKIDVECDGDFWHDEPNQVHYDKRRNNELESVGWSVLRFTEEDIKMRLDQSVSLIYDTINRCGGYEVLNEPNNSYTYIQRGGQLRLDF